MADEAEKGPEVRWPLDRVERLKELWHQNRLSASGIANALGTTRNAVMGKIHRLGMSGNNKITTERVETKSRRRPVTVAPHLAPHEAPHDEPLEFLNRKLDELGSRDCHYPQGEWPPYLYCGQRVLDGSRYCPTHHRLCRQGGKHVPDLSSRGF
jgi:GcrA cell cycle regulator